MIEKFDMSFFDIKRFAGDDLVPSGKRYKTINMGALRRVYDKYDGTKEILYKCLERVPFLVSESVTVKKWIMREVGELPEVYETAEREDDGRSVKFIWRNE